MNAERYRQLVAQLFPRTGARASRSGRVALEHELATSDVLTGGSVAIERLRAATRGAAYAPYLTFEPGGPPVARRSRRAARRCGGGRCPAARLAGRPAARG